MKRSYPSGAEKRKAADDKNKKLQQIPKLTSFFNYSIATVTSSTPSITVSTCNATSDVVHVSASKPRLQADTSTGFDPRKSTDTFFWKPIDNTLREYWITQGPDSCQNHDCDLAKSVRQYEEAEIVRTRKLTPIVFQRRLKNGEVVKRDWLLYSPQVGSIFCFVCRLFSVEISPFAHNGFSDWKHVSSRVVAHENSIEHGRCMLTYAIRHKESGRVDTELFKQFESERVYWRQVLQRVVAVVKFLASRGLPFRGDNQNVGSQQNGNYLGVMELISEFDPFLKEHLQKYGNMGKGNPSYLSATIADEFILLMGEKVLHEIISEIKQAKYYCVCVDSTPDISNVDQLTFTICYMEGSQAIERFLQFVPIYSHTGENLAETVLNFLEKYDILFSNCIGQSYDNAPNMSGSYAGLQGRLQEINNLAVYIPCAAHSLI